MIVARAETGSTQLESNPARIPVRWNRLWSCWSVN